MSYFSHSLRQPPLGVTIVIPNWNHELVLPRSIRSSLMGVQLLREQNIPADVLVIDDFSRDGSRPLLRQLEALYYDDGLRLLFLNENIGISAVRNLAIHRARYQYILFMDADNELIPENLYHFYRSIVDTQATLVYGNIIRHGAIKGYLGTFNNESFQNHIFKQNYIDTFALYDRVQLFDTNGYIDHPLMAGHEDWELILHLATSGRLIVFVPMLMGYYYDLPTSRVDATRSQQHVMERQQYIERVFNQIGLRWHLHPNTHHLRYHPDVGYV